MKKHYNNVVIGFGKAGKTLATWLAARGEEVAVIEKSKQMYGGSCINIACIPTKSLIVNAEKGTSYTDAHDIKDQLTGALREKNYKKVADAEKATVVDGSASFISPNTLRVVGHDGERTIVADRIFINTGTKPMVPEIEGADGSKIYTSTTLMELEEKPQRLVIVGGGFIGLEFADMYLKFGTDVYLLDSHERLLPNEDADIREAIESVLEEKGLHFLPGAKVERFREGQEGVAVDYKMGKQRDTIKADAVLLATGRTTETEPLDLKAAGIETDKKGYIVVDDQLRTSAEHVWAIGDINGGPQFTYISLDDFRIIKNQIIKGKYNSVKKRQPFATTVFITPPYARIGMNETEAKEQGLDFSVYMLSADHIPKAAILREERGILKAIVDNESGKILGCMLYCAEAHEMINTIQLAMNANFRYEILRDQIYTHPSMTESFNELFSSEALNR